MVRTAKILVCCKLGPDTPTASFGIFGDAQGLGPVVRLLDNHLFALTWCKMLAVPSKAVDFGADSCVGTSCPIW